MDKMKFVYQAIKNEHSYEVLIELINELEETDILDYSIAELNDEFSLLHLAVKYCNDERIIQAIIDKAPNAINFRTFRNGLLPLDIARLNDNEPIIKILIKNDEIINNRKFKYKDIFGIEKINPLKERFMKLDFTNVNDEFIEALRRGNTQRLNKCIKLGVDFRINSHIALVFAISNGYLEIEQKLIQAGADISLSLLYAAENGMSEIFSKLILLAPDINSYSEKAFISAIRNRNLSIVNQLIHAGANVNLGRLKPLLLAISNKNPEIVDRLIEVGADVNTVNGMPLVLAISNEYLEIEQKLIQEGADISLSLSYAAENGVIEIIDVLIQKGANVNSYDGKALLLAVKSGNLAIVDKLIQLRANVNLGEIKPFYFAAMHGDMKMVNRLIDAGVDVNLVNGEGLVLAMVNGHQETVNRLIKAGANFSLSLTYAAFNGISDITDKLIKLGANVNDYNGKALACAIEMGYLQIEKKLINAGANINLSLIYAVENNKFELIKMLIQKNAEVNSDFWKMAKEKKYPEEVIRIVKEALKNKINNVLIKLEDNIENPNIKGENKDFII